MVIGGNGQATLNAPKVVELPIRLELVLAIIPPPKTMGQIAPKLKRKILFQPEMSINKE